MRWLTHFFLEKEESELSQVSCIAFPLTDISDVTMHRMTILNI